MTNVPEPFDVPAFSFRAGAVAGSAPLRTMFYPMVKSGIAEFQWDFDGNGHAEERTKGPISWEYKIPGAYYPRAVAIFNDGNSAVFLGDEIEVVAPKLEPLQIAAPPMGENDRWETARRIHVGDRHMQQGAGIDVYKFSCHKHGLYDLRLKPIMFAPPRPLELLLLTESGKFIASTSGGWLRVPLSDHNTYQIQVKGNGYYSLTLDEAKENG